MSILLDALKKAAGSEGKAASSDEDGGSSYLQASQTSSLRWPFRLAVGGGIVSLLLFLWWWNPGRENTHLPSGVQNPALQPSGESTISRNPPSDSLSPSREGLSFFHRGDYAKASSKFQETIALDPDSAVAYNNLGLSLKKMGRSEEASQAYQKALMLDPSYVEAMNNLAVLYIMDNKMDKASELFINALQHRPQYPEVHLNYAVLLEQTGNQVGAVEHYGAYLKFASPQDPMVVQIRDHIRQIQ